MPRSQPNERAADRLARRLAEAGCRYAFGIPGGEVLTLMDALALVGITFVTAKHETAAAFMAEGVWQRTGTPPVLVATVGPGVSNAVNGVANARLDRVPLIVLAGSVDAEEALTYNHQIIDHKHLLEPAIKGAFTLTADAADLVTEKALALAMDPRPGPVLIEVPIAVADAPSKETKRLRRSRPAAVAPAPGPDLESARQWLAAAKRPLVIAGFDAVQNGAGPALRRFAEVQRAPVIQTYKAKGILPEDHPFSLAAAALSPAADEQLLPIVEAADLIVLAGYDAVEMRRSWQSPWDPENKHVIAFDAVPNDHYLHLAAITFTCDCGAGLDLLGDDTTSASTWTADEVAATRARVLEPFKLDEAWGPAAICDVARKVLPRETVAIPDVGAHRILFDQVWQAFEPRTVLQSNGLCTMGCAVPLGIGAKLADPARPVAVFTGDGGLLMVLGELATAAEQNLPLIVICFVDQSLALIDVKQQERQLARLGVAVGRFDAVALAKGLGGRGVVAADREALAAALEEALAAPSFTLIACPIQDDAYDGRI